MEGVNEINKSVRIEQKDCLPAFEQQNLDPIKYFFNNRVQTTRRSNYSNSIYSKLHYFVHYALLFIVILRV